MTSTREDPRFDAILAAEAFAAKVAPVYSLLRWYWKRNDRECIPTMADIRDELQRMIRQLPPRGDYAISTGGLRVTRDAEGVTLAMEITWITEEGAVS